MAKIGILFWNTAGRVAPQHLSAIGAELHPEIILLTESRRSRMASLEALNSSNRGLTYTLPLETSERLQFFVASSVQIRLVHDGGHIAIRHVQPIIGRDFLLVGVHLPSKLHLSDDDQALLLTRVARRIADAEETIGHTRTIVVGDFNMNPFESGVVGSEGFHAVMARAIAARESRTVLGEERRLFYNPMWSLLGDMSAGPPGTYYYHASAPVSYFWHMFDQVLLRASFARALEREDIEILTAVGSHSFLDRQGRPDRRFSDHLPIFIRINLEEDDRGDEESMG